MPAGTIFIGNLHSVRKLLRVVKVPLAPVGRNGGRQPDRLVSLSFAGGVQQRDGHIQPMNAVIAQVARAIVIQPAPASVKAVNVKRSLWCRPHPHVVVDSGGRRAIRRKTNRPLFRTLPRLGNDAATQFSALNKFDGCLQTCRRPMLRSHLHDAFMFTHRSHHPHAFNDIVTIRFFDVDIPARLARKNCGNGMPVIGRPNNDCVNRVIVDEPPKVAFATWSALLIFLGGHQSFRKAIRIQIRDRDNFDRRIRGKRIDQRQRPPTRANDADPNTFAMLNPGRLRGLHSNQTADCC